VPVDLTALLDPAHAALLMMECQEGVIGGGGKLGALAEAVACEGTVERIARVLAAARARRVPVFHCTMAARPDRAGAVANCLLLAATRKNPTPLVLGSPQWAPVAPLAPAEGEWVLHRWHGLSPFHATELDQLLRNLGVRTVVATGVSVNVGIVALTLDAVNAGYQVVIPRDATAGTPADYVDAVYQHTLRLLATVTTSDAVAASWGE
jgi:nicotinamidase-related amidase